MNALRRMVSLLCWGLLLAAGCWAAVQWVLFQGRVSPDVLRGMGVARDLLDGLDRGRQGLVLSIWRPPLPTLTKLAMCRIGGDPMSLVVAHAFSVAAALGACMALWTWARWQKAPWWACLLWTGALLIEPGFVAAAVGGRDVVLVVCLLSWGGVRLAQWTESRSTGHLVTFSICCALASLARPMAILVVPMGAVFILAETAMEGVASRWKPWRWPYRKMEGTLVLFLIPSIYAMSLWLLFGWLIMGDPLSWLRGFLLPPWIHAVPSASWPGQDPMLQLKALCVAAWRTSPLFCIALVAGFGFSRGSRPFLLVGLMAPLWHFLLMRKGIDWGLQDDGLLLIPLGYMALAPWASTPARGVWRKMRCLVAVGMMLASLGWHGLRWSSGQGVRTQAQAILDAELDRLSDGQDSPSRWSELRSVAEKLKGLPEDSWVFVAGFPGYDLRWIMPSNRLMHTLSSDLAKVSTDTAGRPLYVLIPQPVGEDAFNPMNLAAPTMYQDGAPFLLFDGEWTRWRMWRLVRPSASVWGVTPPLDFRAIGE